MRFFMWQFDTLSVPMMEDEQTGVLYTTGSVLAVALQVTEQNLRSVYMNHKDEFDGNRVNDIDAISFLGEHREAFKIKYLRPDMHAWSEDDMILFAALSNSDQGKAFRKAMKELVKQQARKGLITQEYFDSVVSQLMERVVAIEQAKDHLDATASALGAGLAHQRYTKNFRS